MMQNELLYIQTIAEQGNLTRAAKELFIAQPSLSEILSRVESDLGQPLFTRTLTGMVPTVFGLHYLQTAAKIQNRYRQMLGELEEYRKMQRGNLTFGIPGNLGTYLLPAMLPVFHKLYPEITIQFRENNSTELNKLMLSGKLDFSIMHQEGSPKGILCDYLTEDPFYLVLPLETAKRLKFPGFRELSRLDLKLLAEEPFLMVAANQKLRLVTDAILEKAGLKPSIRYTTKSMETAKRLAAAGMGATFLPYSYLNLFSGTEHLACYPLEAELQAYWRLVIAYPSGYPLSNCAYEFIKLLKKVVSTTTQPVI